MTEIPVGLWNPFLFCFPRTPLADSSETTTCDGATLCRAKSLSLLLDIDALQGDDQQERGFTLIIAFLSRRSEIAFAFFLLSPPCLKVRRAHRLTNTCVRKHALTRVPLISPWVPLTLELWVNDKAVLFSQKNTSKHKVPEWPQTQNPMLVVSKGFYLKNEIKELLSLSPVLIFRPKRPCVSCLWRRVYLKRRFVCTVACFPSSIWDQKNILRMPSLSFVAICAKLKPLQWRTSWIQKPALCKLMAMCTHTQTAVRLFGRLCTAILSQQAFFLYNRPGKVKLNTPLIIPVKMHIFKVRFHF